VKDRATTPPFGSGIYRFDWVGDGTIRYDGLKVLDWTLLAILAGCMQTIWVRLARIIRTIHKEEGKLAEGQQAAKD
jgi:hypothetical protein